MRTLLDILNGTPWTRETNLAPAPVPADYSRAPMLPMADGFGGAGPVPQAPSEAAYSDNAFGTDARDWDWEAIARLGGNPNYEAQIGAEAKEQAIAQGAGDQMGAGYVKPVAPQGMMQQAALQQAQQAQVAQQTTNQPEGMGMFARTGRLNLGAL